MNKMIISKSKILSMERASRRNEEILVGIIPTNKVHKSLKTYTRKAKHKQKYD